MSVETKLTVRQFMLKKFPTNEYMDCPVPKHHWETIQEFADQQTASLQKEFEQQGINLGKEIIENERLQKEVERLKRTITSHYGGGFTDSDIKAVHWENKYESLKEVSEQMAKALKDSQVLLKHETQANANHSFYPQTVKNWEAIQSYEALTTKK